MSDRLVLFQVCEPVVGCPWYTILSCETRDEAERELRRLRGVHPAAFIARVEWTRVNRQRPVGMMSLV